MKFRDGWELEDFGGLVLGLLRMSNSWDCA